MIISYPFLGTDTANSQEDRAEAFTVDIQDYECAHGIYPVSFEQRWHGGCHLAPLQQFEPVRAIADGTIVAYRIASTPLAHDGKSHHNSFVLLKHETETGDGRKLICYSLYMHLHCLDPEISQPLRNTIIERLRTPGGDANQAAVSDGHTKVYRKDVLGFAGGMYGHRFIHFEIFMAQGDSARNLAGDFNHYFAPTRLQTAPLPGRPQAAPAEHAPDYWGDSYYLIPQGTAMLARHPKANSHHQIGKLSFPPLQGIERTTIPLLVQIRFDKGDKVTTVWHGSNIGQRISNQETSVRGEYGVRDQGFEYGMYRRALTLYPACPSAGYELLRFGSLLGPDRFPASTPASDQENWQPVEFASGQAGYVNLSAANVKKFSDAGFHPLCGWTKFEHPSTSSAQVSLLALQKLLRDADSNHDARTTPEELVAWVRRDEVRKKLRRMICLAPTEWSAAGAETKFAFLKTEKGFNDSQFANFIALINKFQFWDKLSGIPENVWHFHPLEFVAHFRKCGWLSKEEFAQCFPRKLKVLKNTVFIDEASTSWETAITRASSWAKVFNLAARRYGASLNPARLIHFFAQTIPETGNLRYVKENDGETKFYNPFYGRGILQLTREENYEHYGKFRKLSTPPPYSDPAFNALGWDPNTVIANDNNGHHNPSNCADCSFFYCIEHTTTINHQSQTMWHVSDSGSTIADFINSSKVVNGNVADQNINGLDKRIQAGILISYALLDKPTPLTPITITFTWRRNSYQEPAIESGQPVYDSSGHQKKKFYPTVHNITITSTPQRP